jgi:hypothetical protein
MSKNETPNIEYLSRAFTGLSDEKKDYVLNKARSLLEVQEGNVYFEKLPAAIDEKAVCTKTVKQYEV